MIGKEGKTKILLYGKVKDKGPGIKRDKFYNPAMKLDRDLCVLFCWYAVKNGCKKFLDGLGATGVRGIRIANEVEGIDMHINEINPVSYEIIKKNAEINNLKINAMNGDIRMLCRNKYDYIDIDPYGSPAPFALSAFERMRGKGFAAFTATDKATLCGVYKSTCIRRYGAVPMHGEGMKEIGLRILIGFLVRTAAMKGYGAYPVFLYSHDHYFRVYLRLEKGARKGGEAVKKIGWICRDNGWKTRKFCNERGEKWAGPLWIGSLNDKDVVEFMAEKAENKRNKKLLEIIKEEVDAPPMYYDGSSICKRLKIVQPKLLDIIGRLREKDFFASRTHFSPIGFKTDANVKEIEKVFRQLQQ
ncbi:MAG: tRNA (guanine(10)-N(2))-dimethyltransferase [Candidatus Thermoplasmatota archaeon]|nr:tRNA (guanine(10)-N(2))-dimethyltransferase [Candidatus Thermoplasmatota archaeon]